VRQRERNQISQAQFRANNGASARVTGKEIKEKNWCASASGKIHANAAGTGEENWFWNEEVGVAETGCDPGTD